MLRVTPDDVGLTKPDLFFGAVGYEERSIYTFGILGRRRASHMFVYPNGGDTEVKRRVESVERLGARTHVCATDLDFARTFSSVLRGVSNSRIRSVGIDISSLGRRRIAHIVAELSAPNALPEGCQVEFYYAPGKYQAPQKNPSSSLVADAVTDRFRGALRSLSLPLAAVIGLGYEPFRAIGVFELLEPGQTWAFFPESEDENYESALLSANRLLRNSLSPSSVLDYPVLRPSEAYKRLESLVVNASDDHRIVLVPMGPKIFAVCCLLLGLDSRIPAPAVWRVGERFANHPVPVEPRGQIVGLRTVSDSSRYGPPALD
jgi:hypothetical protein